jgi:hypothetical protein
MRAMTAARSAAVPTACAFNSSLPNNPSGVTVISEREVM